MDQREIENLLRSRGALLPCGACGYDGFIQNEREGHLEFGSPTPPPAA